MIDLSKIKIIKHKDDKPKGLKENGFVFISARSVTTMKRNKHALAKLPHGAFVLGKVFSKFLDKRGHGGIDILVQGLYRKGESGYVKASMPKGSKLPSLILVWIEGEKTYLHDPWKSISYKTITKNKIWDYYHHAWPILKKDVLGHNVTIIPGYKDILGQVIRNEPGTKTPILIRSFDDIDTIIFRHGIEFIPDLQRPDEYGKTRRGVIDVDSKAPLGTTKNVVLKVYDRLEKIGYDPYIVSTSSKAGFHVRFDLNSPVDINQLKGRLLKDVIQYLYDNDPYIKETILDPAVLSYSKKEKEAASKIFLDLAPMKARGGIKAVGSINAKTLGFVKIVPIAKLSEFKPIPNEILEWGNK